MRQSIRPIRRIIVVLSFALATAIPMPADTGERIYDFYSPTFLSEGATVVGAESPQADIFNPAIGAGAQRTILDVSYLGIADGSEGYLGHAVNIGNTIPTKVGVVSWSGHFISSSLSEYTIGAQGGLRASFAKDLFPKFHVGAGVNLSFGSGWALTASLGVINYLGDLGPLKDFTWGAALQEMGYATFNAEVGDYPPLFTLAGGASCVLIDNEIIRLKALTEISVPGFTNFRFRLGGTVTFIDTIYLSFNSVVDVDEIRDAGAATMIPAFGVGFTYKLDLKGDISFLNITERGWNRGEIKVQTAAAPLRSGIWGFGLGANVPLGVLDRNPPRIAVEYPEALYLSPNLDGISDDLVLPITITDERYVAGYRFFITDPSGAVIREIRNKEYRPENEQEKTIFERFAAVKSGIAIPDSILWAGLSDEGSTVPDGTYAFAIEAWDDNGNIATEGPYTIHIDNPPPTILLQKIEGNDLIFSPNGAGAKDTIRIVQEGSREDRCVGKISDVSGTIHRTLQWSDNEPSLSLGTERTMRELSSLTESTRIRLPLSIEPETWRTLQSTISSSILK